MPAFYINAATYLVSAVFILFVRVPRVQPDAGRQRGSLVAEATEGLRYAARHRAI